jgi:hypothetical protein
MTWTNSIEQLTSLLGEYFVGPIARSTVEKIHAEREVLERDASRKAGEENALRSNGKRYFGQLWRERIDQVPDPLVLWIAVSRGGQLTPRLYCPRELVGSWTQSSPAPARWEVAADGTMTTTDPTLRASARWCVHRTADEGGGPEGDELRVYRGESSDFEALLIDRASATELALTWVSPKADVPYQLRRS